MAAERKKNIFFMLKPTAPRLRPQSLYRLWNESLKEMV